MNFFNRNNINGDDGRCYSREEGLSDATTSVFLPNRVDLYDFLKNDIFRLF